MSAPPEDRTSTRRLYYTDAYVTTFTSRVVGRADDGRRIYLEQTAFYPTSGGQPHDRGSLGGTDVVDVIDEGDRIAHVLASPAPTRDDLEGHIDWRRRFDFMQQHTGQHLLSAVIEELCGARTVSVHFGDDASTLDVDAETLTRDQLTRAEDRANAIVAEDRPVMVTFEDASEAAGLRKASDREGILRVVSIEGLDRSACGGTHVRSTGAIGAVLLRKVEKIRKSARVEFVCGLRAVRRARADFMALTSIASSLSSALDEAPAIVQSQSTQLRDAESVRRKLERELAEHRARELYTRTAPDERGRHVAVVTDVDSMDTLRVLAQVYATLSGAVLVGVVGSPPALIFAAAEDTGVDAGRVLREAVTSVGGRGGGSPRVAQASVPDAESARVVMERLTES
jgi:alanyl-tRNA synthetase